MCKASRGSQPEVPIQTVKSYLYPILLGVSALSISLSSAYYSIYGLGALFAGAALQIMVMAGTLEFAKVVLAGFLHRFWKDLPTLLRSYLSVAVVILIVISSMGIYGYLASAYQNSSLELGSVEDRIEMLEGRKSRYTQQIASINQERQGLTSTILTLSQGLTGNTIQYIDPQSGQLITTQSAAARNILQQQLTSARDRESLLSTQVDVFSDSLIVLDNRVFEVKDASSATRNLGPLLFLSQVSGMSMDKVVNILIVVIMLVFDPLAVTMIVATSVSFDVVRKPRKELKVESKKKESSDPQEEFENIPFTQEFKPTNSDQTLVTFEKYFQPPDDPEQQLESSEKNRKVREIRKLGKHYHITYEDGSVDRIHETTYYKFVNDNNIKCDKVRAT